jgi:hypothetical protein
MIVGYVFPVTSEEAEVFQPVQGLTLIILSQPLTFRSGIFLADTAQASLPWQAGAGLIPTFPARPRLNPRSGILAVADLGEWIAPQHIGCDQHFHI